MDFTDTVRGGADPNTSWIAPHSVVSLAFVPVPCAEIRSTWSGVTPASSSASRMHAATLSRSGATGWVASQFSP